MGQWLPCLRAPGTPLGGFAPSAGGWARRVAGADREGGRRRCGRVGGCLDWETDTISGWTAGQVGPEGASLSSVWLEEDEFIFLS